MDDAPALIAVLQEAAPGASVEPSPTIDQHPTIYVDRDRLSVIALALRDHPTLRFDFLAELTAVDFHPREPRFEIVYVLVSIARAARLRLKVRLHGEDAHVATVTSVWPAANWLEREVWDMFGVVFDGHPDPRRLLMPDDWEGYPLRKDYPVQIRKAVQTGEPLQVTEQEFRANLERDRLVRE
jgi:NADH-quinone oxidoreductase subunit C